VGEKTPHDVRQYAERINTQRLNLEALAQAMEEMGASSVRLDGVTKITRGLDLVDEFALLLEMAIKRAELEKRKAEAG